MQAVKLGNTGVKVPMIAFGLGTAWYKAQGDKISAMKESIKMALNNGYRHLDCAQMYQNEKYVGEALQEWYKTQEDKPEVFITSKLEDDKVIESFNETLSNLKVDYLHLYLIHDPFRHKRPLRELWGELEKLVDAGKIKAIGVSNYRLADLEELMSYARIKPVCNQIEVHPYLFDRPLLDYCKSNGIQVFSYGGLGPIVRWPEGPLSALLERLSSKYSATPAQLLQKWLLANGVGVVTTSSKESRLQQYLASPRVALSQQDVALITDTGAQEFHRNFWTSEMLSYDQERGVVPKTD